MGAEEVWERFGDRPHSIVPDRYSENMTGMDYLLAYSNDV